MIRRMLLLGAAALLLVACGSDDGRFDDAVGEVRAAVQDGDRDTAFAHLDEIGSRAMQAHADGDLDEAEVAELGGLLEQARLLVSAELPEPTTTTEATQPPPAEPVPAPVVVDDDDDDDDDDDGKGRKGKGKKDRDDD